jgi:hypothetical protein
MGLDGTTHRGDAVTEPLAGEHSLSQDRESYG